MAEDVKQILNEYKEETKRHFDVVAERLEDKIGILSEQVAANTEKLEEHDQRFESIQEKLEEHDRRFDQIDGRFNRIDDTLEVIKIDIEFIKNELKQKVSRDEFVVLEKRVSMLEAKSGK